MTQPRRTAPYYVLRGTVRPIEFYDPLEPRHESHSFSTNRVTSNHPRRSYAGELRIVIVPFFRQNPVNRPRDRPVTGVGVPLPHLTAGRTLSFNPDGIPVLRTSTSRTQSISDNCRWPFLFC